MSFRRWWWFSIVRSAGPAASTASTTTNGPNRATHATRPLRPNRPQRGRGTRAQHQRRLKREEPASHHQLRRAATRERLPPDPGYAKLSVGQHAVGDWSRTYAPSTLATASADSSQPENEKRPPEAGALGICSNHRHLRRHIEASSEHPRPASPQHGPTASRGVRQVRPSVPRPPPGDALGRSR
jgi:hypothetical protein